MLCKGSALSKSHFLLWKRNVVEPNDVYLNISFECHITLFLLYCLGFGLTRQAYWKFLSCDVNISEFPLLVKTYGGKHRLDMAGKKGGGVLEDALFSV